MPSKFGYFFHSKLRHYLWIQKKQIKSFHQSVNLLNAIHKRTPFQSLLLPSICLLLEENKAIVYCFREGLISSALHQLRMVHELVQKLIVMIDKPSLVHEKKISPSVVRKLLRENKFPDWSEFYSPLCEISHTNKDFLINAYPIIMFGSQVTIESEFIIKYYLSMLNLLNLKSMIPINLSLKPHMGSDYLELENEFDKLAKIILSDFEFVQNECVEIFSNKENR